ncbi:MAG: hypothetical protein AAF563_22165 [Pseudomonadota bacterium]
MQSIREVLGAWLVVAALAFAIIAVWGWRDSTSVASQAIACVDENSHQADIALHGVEVPRGGWQPEPILAGLPGAGDRGTTSYEAAEERNLLALEAPPAGPMRMAQGSSTNLNPTSIC